jgi:hypothetical protein
MKNRKLFCCFVVAIVIALVGCEERRQVPDQMAFMHQISVFKLRYEDLNYLEYNGKDSNGRLVPADISEQVKASDREILQYLKDTPRNAVQWIATVVGVHRKGSMVVLNASYGMQSYSFHIYDPQAVKIAEQFTGDEEIVFSGNLGPERSMTIIGALAWPSFSLYPTRLSSKHGEITQSLADIPKAID